MAQATLTKSSLRLMFDNGVDENGKQLFQTKTYSNVKTDVTPDQFNAAAAAIAGLSARPLVSIERNDTSTIN
ncbi:DUF1659 domain-containing protein [Domibacillus sp. DTU_2020_1001157_1_SI_ALB_TIR_016]|uniref:DUF1659 domain-containing protein n=1 Tax=Domibacillus sp. DTU_2020_1001157_1_SI_ALB_TIR_016 TaxID=3077789 RepID=UPI0028E72DCF|nr:DUF1659 domain-containing protein [Domibacillus sp. DTU_2020_1001157_1_SI_ALB_TIR_016]WNS81493.1 DUF1659 domain-containing protein [Domibacillus sp. DTU_2020_1001157_1_SI_ALB_TIR_016]